MRERKLKQGRDFYYDNQGRMVLTELYHLKRGKCCGNICNNCPFKPRFERGNTNIDES